MVRGNASGDESDEGADGQEIYHRQITPEAEAANESLLRLIADLENCEITDLPPLYTRIDDVLSDLFSSPPPPEAQAKLEFSYYGYRVEVDQTGDVSLMKLDYDSPTDADEP